MYKKLPINRYKQTLKMLKEVCPAPAVIFDLGVRNPFSEIMKQNNYEVYNTSGEDLDEEPNPKMPNNVDLVTGFEIIEHLVSPYPLLKNIKAKRIFLTVPIKLWFSKAYKSETDPFDRHYHEFEPWQFDWLLEKSGWKIIKKEYWTNPTKKIGLRPFLRLFVKRYYAVYAERV